MDARRWGSTVAVALLGLLAATARAEEPASDQAAREAPPAFGQDPGAERATARIRLEAAFFGAWADSTARFGPRESTNRWNPHADLGVPRFAPGVRAALSFKLWDFYGMGLDYVGLVADGSSGFIRRGLRAGSPPADIRGGTRAAGRVELEQLSYNLRLWVRDDATLRFEPYLGVTWVGYHAVLRPAFVPDGPTPARRSLRTEAWFAPMLGIFLAWNPVSRFGLYLDSVVNWFSWDRVGSTAGITRFGARVRVADGFELVAGAIVLSGQVYDIEDAFRRHTGGHRFRKSSWLAIGPEIGLSLTL